MAAQDSLSVVLPVHNAADKLTKSVIQLLDIIPDLTQRFEILVVDDGSQDQTAEVAYDLARIYPQVLVAEHGTRRGRTGVVETALARTSGDILLVQDENAPIHASSFQRLWALRGNERMAMPVTRLLRRPSLARRIAAWGMRIEDNSHPSQAHGVQLIRRSPRVSAQAIPNSAAPLARRCRIDAKSGAISDSVPQFTVPHDSKIVS